MDSRRRIFLLMGFLFAFSAIGLFAVLSMRPVDDQKLIREGIAAAIQASKEGKPGGVLELISLNLKVNDQDAGNRIQIADFIKRMKPEVEVPPVQAMIEGDFATVRTDVKMTFGILGQRSTVNVPGITILMKKEEERGWFFVPSRKWKMSEVRIDTTLLPNLGFM